MEKTIYETIGGAPTVTKVVAVFYEKILGDDSINHIFKKHQYSRPRRSRVGTAPSFVPPSLQPRYSPPTGHWPSGELRNYGNPESPDRRA